MRPIGVGVRGTLPQAQLLELKPEMLIIPHFVGPPSPFIVEVRPIVVPLNVLHTDENLVGLGCDVFFHVDAIAEGDAYEVSLKIMDADCRISSSRRRKHGLQQQFLTAQKCETVFLAQRFRQAPSWEDLLALLSFAWSKMSEEGFTEWQELHAREERQRVITCGSE